MSSFLAMLAALLAESNVPPRIVLGGFSQGAMVATDIALRTEIALEGLVLLSGTLTNADEWVPRMPSRRGLRVFQSHGSEDEILPTSLAHDLAHHFERAGVSLTKAMFDGGHGVPPLVLDALGDFLSALG